MQVRYLRVKVEGDLVTGKSTPNWKFSCGGEGSALNRLIKGCNPVESEKVFQDLAFLCALLEAGKD